MTEPTQPETITLEYMRKGTDPNSQNIYTSPEYTMYPIVICHNDEAYILKVDIRLMDKIPPESILKIVPLS